MGVQGGMCVGGYMCVVCVPTGGQKPEGDVRCLLYWSPLFSLETFSLPELVVRLGASKLLQSSCLYLPKYWCKCKHATTPAFWMGARGSNSCPHTCLASTLTYWTLPQSPQRFEFCLDHRRLSFGLTRALLIPPGCFQGPRWVGSHKVTVSARQVQNLCRDLPSAVLDPSFLWVCLAEASLRSENTHRQPHSHSSWCVVTLLSLHRVQNHDCVRAQHLGRSSLWRSS